MPWPTRGESAITPWVKPCGSNSKQSACNGCPLIGRVVVVPDESERDVKVIQDVQGRFLHLRSSGCGTQTGLEGCGPDEPGRRTGVTGRPVHARPLAHGAEFYPVNRD